MITTDKGVVPCRVPSRFVLAFSLAAAIVLPAARILAAPPAGVGDPSPSFKVTDTAGRMITLDLQKGDGRVTVFFFWSLRVPPCLREMEFMEKLHGQWQSRRITIVGVEATGTGPDGMPDLLEKLAAIKITPSYSVAADPGRSLAALLGAGNVPTTLVIDPNGIIRLRLDGFSAEQAAAIEQAVADIYTPRPAIPSPGSAAPAPEPPPAATSPEAPPAPSPQQQEFEKHRYFGEFHFNRGDYDKALESFRRCLEIYPGNVAVLLRMGETYAMKKDFVRARETWEEVLRASPGNAEADDFLRRLLRGDFR